MNEIQKKIDELLKEIKNNPLKSEQGLDLDTPEPGQLHRVANFYENPDLFYLITEVDGNYCEVIPGSFDAVMASTNDIILPADIMGRCVFMSLDLAATLPINALGKGFARLDKKSYNRVIDSQLQFETGETGEYPSFIFSALPYANNNDPRKIYHDQIVKVIQEAQQELYAEIFEELPEQISISEKIHQFFADNKLEPIWTKTEYALAAGEEKENLYLNCRIEGRTESVKIIYAPDEKTLRLTIFDGSQRTKTLDGTEIVDVNENSLGVIAEGKCFIENLHDFDGCFALLLENGEIVSLTYEQE